MANTISNESLKEYYVKLQGMYDNCYNMLTAIQQSLMTNASEITVSVMDTDDVEQTIRIPSFLYLENKLEQLDMNMSRLFNMPNSGEAWMTKSSNMYKLNFVRSSSAPVQPVPETTDLWTGFEPSVILKDLVTPHMFLRMSVSNLPELASQMYMKKIVLFDRTTYDTLKAMELHSYDEWRAALYNYRRGEDYEEYDNIIPLPVRKDTFKSQFDIIEVLEDPWVDPADGNIKKVSYKLRLSTLEYTDEEDSSIRFTLKPGDAICLGNEMVVYVVKSVDTGTNSVIVEEVVGHIALQTYEENSEMQLSLYNDNYAKYKYVNVPLEENQYVCIFLGVLYNNVRSSLSDGILLNLAEIYMRDSNGEVMRDDHGNPMTYMDYYNEYCTNIGDLILGLTEAAYPQLSNYTAAELQRLTESEEAQAAVSNSLDPDESLEVVAINKHLLDDTSSEEIVNLHAQKNNLQSQLLTINDNISQVYNTLTTTDFSQSTANTFVSLQSKLTSYYTQRTTLQKQLNAVIDNIAAKSMDVSLSYTKTKYHIRGLANYDAIDSLCAAVGTRTAVTGIDVEYKYKSTSKDTNTVTVINSSTFTDWNRQPSIPRARHLAFDDNIRSWTLKFNEYKTTDNIIKWNQIDIPITPGEDVVIRLRFHYNIGQPFVDLVTPWSDEMTVVFPEELKEDTNVMDILDTNRRDTIVAGYREILMNEGYEEHVTNKIVAGDQVFLHQPQNIYSGFTTPENNLISLYDKLTQMSQDIEQYKSWAESESNSKFEVYLQYDEQQALLAPNSINNINIYNTDHITGTFIKKKMNIVIKNTGTSRLNLYSIFPGNNDISLIKSDIDSYINTIGDYERVPMLINEKISLQHLGQWIYFRQTNPYTREDIYMNTYNQRSADESVAISGQKDCTWIPVTPTEYMMNKNMQVLYAYRDRTGVQASYSEIMQQFAQTMKQMSDVMEVSAQAMKDGHIIDDSKYNEIHSSLSSVDNSLELLANYNGIFRDVYNSWTDEDFMYVNTMWSTKSSDVDTSNVYLSRYEDIIGINEATGALIHLDSATNLANFLSQYSPKGFTQDTDFSGAFIYPDILSRQQVSTGNSAGQVFIDSGESISIPIVFEYYLDGTKDDTIDHTSVTKSLYFDIKNSLIKNPIHYMIDVTGHYDFTSTGDVYSNFDNVNLEDLVTQGD